MGVSLSLDGSRQGRGRSRGGQHTRTAEDQACLDALAAFLRSDPQGAGRCLSKVSRASMQSRLLPAAQTLARAVELVLGSEAPAVHNTEFDLARSPEGQPGLCNGSAAYPCSSPGCQCDCHTQPDNGFSGSADQFPRQRYHSG